MSLLALKLMAAGASGEPAGSAKNIERYAFLGSPVNRMSWQSYWNDKTLLNRRSISDPWGNSQIGGQRVRQFYIREGNNDASIDGKSIYFLDSDSDKLVTLTLGVPYDLNTIIANNYNSGASDFTGIDNQMFYGLWWKPDGTRLEDKMVKSMKEVCLAVLGLQVVVLEVLLLFHKTVILLE
jgi:hypothetical protein